MDSIDMVSVVVPVYKAESTIRRCVDSILAQTYCNFELILVDDGSPDNSGTICDEYAQSDIRVKVFHKENGGVSSARNLGIDNASGKYLVFVDSDDTVTPDYLLSMMQVESSQLVIGGIHKDMDGVHEYWTLQERRVSIPDDLKDAWSRPNDLYIYIFPTAKLYLMEVVKKYHIQFDTRLFYSEDFCFVMDYMSKVDSFDLIEGIGYNYIIPKEELNRSKKYKMNAEQTTIHYEAVEQRMKELEKISGTELADMRNNVYSRLFRNFMVNLHEIRGIKPRLLELRNFARETSGTVFYKYATFHYKGWKRICYQMIYGFLTFVS
ncbi:MAG: glycosyltransferase [Paludibacteraceae bacterium]|nr:glycosyltransferase [Paludibacteraceae bacterium]